MNSAARRFKDTARKLVARRSTVSSDDVVACMLDGDTLCLAAREPIPLGSLAFRHRVTGRSLMARPEPVRSLRPDWAEGQVPLPERLSEFLGEDESQRRLELDIVVSVQGRARPVLTQEARPSPSKAPPTSDGDWTFDLHHARVLSLSATRAEPAAYVRQIRMIDESVDFVLSSNLEAPVSLVIQTTAGAKLAALPAAVDKGFMFCQLPLLDIPWQLGEPAVFMLTSESETEPVKRHANSLVEPSPAAAMPLLDVVAEGQAARLRLVYRNDGQLTGRLLSLSSLEEAASS